MTVPALTRLKPQFLKLGWHRVVRKECGRSAPNGVDAGVWRAGYEGVVCLKGAGI